MFRNDFIENASAQLGDSETCRLDYNVSTLNRSFAWIDRVDITDFRGILGACKTDLLIDTRPIDFSEGVDADDERFGRIVLDEEDGINRHACVDEYQDIERRIAVEMVDCDTNRLEEIKGRDGIGSSRQIGLET